MSNYVKAADKAGDQYLAAVAKGQENVLRSLAVWSKWTPQPAFATDFSAVYQMTAATFSFFERWLEQQKVFAEKLFGLTPNRAANSTSAASAAKPSRSPRTTGTAKPSASKARRSRTTSTSTKR